MTIEIRGLAPLLEVFDMPISLAFYRDTIGFDLVQDSGQGDNSGWVMLRLNDATLMLNTAYDEGERPPAPEPDWKTRHADGAIYFGCPNVDTAYDHLRAKGVDLNPPEITQYGFKLIQVTDPDGYKLCFHWPGNEQ